MVVPENCIIINDSVTHLYAPIRYMGHQGGVWCRSFRQLKMLIGFLHLYREDHGMLLYARLGMTWDHLRRHTSYLDPPVFLSFFWRGVAWHCITFVVLFLIYPPSDDGFYGAIIRELKRTTAVTIFPLLLLSFCFNNAVPKHDFFHLLFKPSDTNFLCSPKKTKRLIFVTSCRHLNKKRTKWNRIKRINCIDNETKAKTNILMNECTVDLYYSWKFAG